MNFDNMTDKELIHEVDMRGGDDLTRALAERLDMRQQTLLDDINTILRIAGATITVETYNLRTSGEANELVE